MSYYPKIILNGDGYNSNIQFTSSIAVPLTGSDSKGRVIQNHGLEFFPRDVFYQQQGRTPGSSLPHGSAATFEISCSAVSKSGGLAQTSSNGLTTVPGSFIQFQNRYSTLNIVFLSSSISGSKISGSNEIQGLTPKKSRYKYLTASLQRGDVSGDFIASRINNAFSMSYATGIARLVGGTTDTSGSGLQNSLIPDSQTGSQASSSYGYITDRTMATELPYSASLHGSIVKIFSMYTGSAKFHFNSELTSSFGFSITETKVGFGNPYTLAESERAKPTASFRLTAADSEAQGIMFSALDPENMIKNHLSASHITALYISRSGAIGIKTEDPKVELGVSGSISASGNIFGVTGSFHYITASVVDVNADTVRIGGEAMNRTLIQNLKDGFDSDARATSPGANFKAGIKTAGNITASGDISSSGTITANAFIGNITGDLTGEADTVATIAGLAPNTATTQATQAAITTAANLTTVGALNVGSITSGFTSIDVGAGAITTTGVVSAGTVNASSHITASGDISSSGTISGSKLRIIGNAEFSGISTFNNTNLGNSSTFDAHIITGRTKFQGNITASNNISASGNFYGSNIGSIYEDYIYLTPTDFNNPVDKALVVNAGEIEDNGGSIADNNARATYHAQKMIPKGYKATHVKVLGSSTGENFAVYSSSFDIGIAGEAGGTTAFGTEKDITDIIGGSGVYCSVLWASRGNEKLYGGYIKLARND